MSAGQSAARRVAMLIAIYFGTFAALLDVSIVNVALPTLQSAFATDTAGLQWIIDAYTLCLSAFMLSAGQAGDRHGRKRLWLIGMALFTAGSAACGLASHLGMLLAGRAVQGLGGALMIPGALSILAQAYPDARTRGSVIGGWAAVSTVALAIGPVLGAALVIHAGWPSLFLVNLPLGLIVIGLGAWGVAESANPEAAGLDPAGQVLSVVWLGALAWGLIAGGEDGFAAPATLGSFAVALVAFVAFVIVELRVARPMLPLGLFRDAGFAATNAASFILGFSAYSSVFFMSLLVQRVQGWPLAETGWRLVPQFLATVLVAPLTGRLAAALGVWPALIGGYALIAGGLLGLTAIGPDTPYLPFGLLLGVVGAGMGLAVPTTSAAAIAAVPRQQSGLAAAITNAVRQTGTAIGIALLGAVMAAGGGAHDLAAGIRQALIIAGLAALAAVAVLAWGRRAAMASAISARS